MSRTAMNMIEAPATINVDLMTKDQLNAKLQRGYDDMMAGRVTPARELFEDALGE